MADTKKVKENCRYWDKCYQKNPNHRTKYNHPQKNYNKIDAQQKRRSSSGSESESETKFETSSSPSKDVETKKRSLSPRSMEMDEESKRQKVSSSPEKSDPRPSSSTEASTQSERVEMDITKEYNEVMRNLEGKNYFELFQRRVLYSQKAEYIELLKSNDFIRHKFLVEMPEEFYQFWNFCGTLVKGDQKPENVFNKLGLKLVGPFDFLAGKFHDSKIQEPGDYLRHWRFFYDPAEFQTIFVKDKTGVHFGYWRDEPSDKEDLLLARNDVNKGCEFEFVAGNCFEALIYYLEIDYAANPFTKATVNEVKKAATAYAQENNISLNALNALKKKREKKVVTKTFHRAGLVVPYDRKSDLGYRALIESDSNLKKILQQFESIEGDKEKFDTAMESLQPVITAASIAVDECDFGTSLELGIDLFCSGHVDLHPVISSLLVPGYSLLQRPQFIAISKAHLEVRKKSNELSIFDIE